MKKLLLTTILVAAGAIFVHADEVALVTFKYERDKSQHQAVFEFYDADAPLTVANFKKLARKKFYNGTTVHRAFPHILVQMGDPISKGKDRSKVGTGGPGYTLPPEIHRKHIAGAISAARLPDKINLTRLSNGSQFFICLQPNPSYDGQYTVFGHVLSGMDTLDAISAKPVDTNDNPVERIEIKSVQILPREKLPVPAAPAAPGKPAPKKSKPWWKVF